MNLNKLQKAIGGSDSLPPVEKWDPPFCGNMDMLIKHDGSWWHQGSPIGRHALVKLFSSVLKKEEEEYFLVTPVEKIGIQVEDTPFVITQWHEHENGIDMTTQAGDSFTVSQHHPSQLMADKKTGDVLPYFNVRRNLWARLHQNVYYQMIALGQEKQCNEKKHLMVSSGSYHFSLGQLD